MDKTELYEKMQKVGDVYTFAVCMFAFLDKKELSKIDSTYNKVLKPDGNSEYIMEIEKIISDLPIYNYSEFKIWLDIWLKEFSTSPLDPIVYTMHSLLRLDGIFNEISYPETNNLKKFVWDKGPFGQIDGYSLFLKKSQFILEKDMDENSIRKGRQTVEFKPNSLNKKFKHFEIISDTSLHDYKPKVKQYNIGNKFGDNIMFALANVGNKSWCDYIQNHITRLFEVEYKDDMITLHNDKVVSAIMEANEKTADIVVFPELSANTFTEQLVKNYFLDNFVPNLKLCFLGSEWENNVNESLLMSSNGTVLIRQFKKAQFSFYDKNQNEMYTENINTKDKNIYFIDIDGFGRLAYLICADYNDADLITVCSVMHADFVFVSAYTNDTKLMKDTAEELAKRRAMITVLSNSCAAIPEKKIKKTLCNFIEIPIILPQELQAEDICCGYVCESPEKCEVCLTVSKLKKVL